ncbi:MAG: N-acyl-D-amino-acid deacylase [Microbacteriaceae bacterium]|nr:N-acyl-D-amino-acid deacylase [Microbacteriaceae bacterium]
MSAPALVDLLIRGGLVVDGTGAAGRLADVLVGSGRIVDVLPPGEFSGTATETIDAHGSVVAPGFVDIHAHSDLAVIAAPGAEQKLRQGVTTEVVGNCGISVVPVSPGFASESHQYATPVLGFPELDWGWSDVDGYLARVDAARPAVNVATYVGLGSIRAAVMGFRPGTPTPEERLEMVDLAAAALEQGAVGLSSGLVYAPGSYSSHDEICEIVEQAARYGALYSSHMRDQGDGFLVSVTETIDVGRRTGAAVQIAHHKVVGERNWGAVTESIAMIRHARATGIDAGSDVYPYLAGSTTMTALLPDWALAGGPDAMLERLADAAVRARIKSDWVTGRPQWDNRVASIGWGNIYISHLETEGNQDLVGLSVTQAATLRARAEGPEDFLLDLLLAEGGAVGNIQVACSEHDLRVVMREPSTSFGSDGLFVGRRPHPRLHGTFPRVLGEYVREEGVLLLEEAIRKMTSLPAGRVGLSDVGTIMRGYRADLVVFDPMTVSSAASYDSPTENPIGIHAVVVNGRIALIDGEPTGVRAGVALRRASVRGPARSDTRLAGTSR